MDDDAPQKMELPIQHRTASVLGRVDPEGEEGADSRRYRLSFSSEDPYKRYDWKLGEFMEVLGHKDGEVDLDWMSSGRAPFLRDHINSIEYQVGVVETATIENRRGVATVRLANTEEGEKLKELIDDGIVSAISVGYRVDEMKLVSTSDDGVDTFRVTAWKPMECSAVSIPADTTVGFGRDEPGDSPRYQVRVFGKERPKPEPEPAPEPNPGPDKPDDHSEERAMTGEDKPEDKPATGNESPEILAKKAADDAREKMQAIMAYGRKYEEVDGPKLAEQVIADGGDMTQLRELINEKTYEAYQKREREFAALKKDGKQTPRDSLMDENGEITLGLTAKEVEGFSFCRAAMGLADPQFAQKDASYEMAVMREAAKLVRASNARPTRAGTTIPADVLQSPMAMSGRRLDQNARRRIFDAARALNVDTGTDALNLVADDFLAASFIEVLRNTSALMPFVTTLSDLVGDVEIPRQTAAVTASWVSETQALTPTDPDFDQVQLSPKELGVATTYSRKTLIQATPDIEMLLRMDFAAQMALALDMGALNGSGTSNQPTGVLRTTGIGSVVGGTNGAAPTWEHIVDLETEVATDNALMGDLRYVVNAKTRGKLKTTQKVAGEAKFIWDDYSMNMPLNGYPAVVSNQVPSNLTKGSASAKASAMLFGNLRDILVGLWSGVDLEVNPYSGQLQRQITLSAFQDVDVAVRHPESFSAMLDVLTD